MFASNNKPTKRSARTRGGAERPHADRRATRSDAQMSRNQSVHSFDRSAYGNSSAHNSRRKSLERKRIAQAIMVLLRTVQITGLLITFLLLLLVLIAVMPKNAKSREFVRQQHERKKKSKRKRILFVSLAVVCVLLLGGIGAAWALH